MTVLETIQRSAEFLAKREVESPRLQAELLLADLLRIPRMRLYLEFDRVLGAEEIEGMRERVKRRGQREPLQHITGSTSFCGFEIAVGREVLVPRPETELLAERGWQFLQERAAENGDSSFLKVLDFGAGSGCLSIALAIQCPKAEVLALDRSPEAVAAARRNAERHQVANRIQFLESNGFSGVPREARFSLIISNPPYIPSAEIGTLQPEVRDYEPRLALDGGADGLDVFRLLAAEAGAFLEERGKLMCEFGDGQAEPLRKLFEDQKWIVEAIHDDYTGRPRILAARRT